MRMHLLKVVLTLELTGAFFSLRSVDRAYCKSIRGTALGLQGPGVKAESIQTAPRHSALIQSSCCSVGTQQPFSSQQSRQPSSLADSRPRISTDGGQSTNLLSSTSRAGQGQGQRPGPSGDRASLEWPSSPRTSETSQQRATELIQLRDALQSLPPSVAEAISRHVSCTNEALQKAESERRVMARSLSAAHSQLAVLPQLQVSTEQHVVANVHSTPCLPGASVKGACEVELTCSIVAIPASTIVVSGCRLSSES